MMNNSVSLLRFLKMARKMNSKGLSSVVATVLIILITITAGAVLLGIIVPFVKNTLQGSSECYPYKDYLKFESVQGSNCISASHAIISIKAKSNERALNAAESPGLNASVAGLELIFYGKDLIRSFKVNGTGSDLIMFGGGAVKIPSPGGIQTYNATGISAAFNRVEVYPILNSGKLCDKNDEIKITSC